MNSLVSFERAILFALQEGHTPFFNWFFVFITTLGNGGLLWIITALFLLCRKKTRKAGIALALSLLFSLLICNLFLKPWVARPRPFSYAPSPPLLIPPPTDFSFPSGHSQSSFAAAYSLFSWNKKLGVLAFLLAFLIALSRLYLFVHFPSDVLIGSLLGLLCGHLGQLCFAKFFEPKMD